MFGPPVGRYFVFFIDDLNMPMLEKYGAQPPIELLRQWMDHRGWYDRKQIGMTQRLCPVFLAKGGLLLDNVYTLWRFVVRAFSHNLAFVICSWFCTLKGTFKKLVDINFVCAMGPPGGGRNVVTPRLTRHFNHLSFTEMEESSKKTIFSTILGSWMGKFCRQLPPPHVASQPSDSRGWKGRN